MNYTLPNKLKLFAIILMVLGAVGIGAGFLSAPGSTAEVKQMMAAHGDDHGEASNESHDTIKDSHDDAAHGASHDAAQEQKHLEHTLHQLQNRPWSALYVACFFFFMIALGALAFYAVNFAAQAGWSPVLFRVMEAVTAYLVPGGIIMFVLLGLSGFHINHLFVWADPEVVAHDVLLQGKAGWLNGTWMLIRAAIFLGGWITYRHFAVKFSRAGDTAKENDYSNFKKTFRISAGFLVFFLISESMMSWDWIMSIDPHWFSTLFGWYVFAGMFVSGITTIALITIYLKSQNYLSFVNNSHIHDLGKFMFGVSVFWAYLWFSQFMLIWYSNIPEEVTYFITRIEDYNFLFFGMVVLNLIFPLIVLMNSDFKKTNFIVILTGIVIIIGHYIDVYNMIMPSAVGDMWSFGPGEIGGFLFFLGIFIYVVFREISKAPILAKGDPYIEESKTFQYYNLD